MTDDAVVAIARIPLARSSRRMLALPVALLLIGLLAAAAGWLLLTDWARIGLMAAGVVLAILAGYLALMVLSIRLEVEVSTLRLRRIRSDRRFSLVRGPVTRVPLRGEGAARLRPGLGALALGVGPARLRGEETIHLVRQAPAASLILVPTDGGRVGIAPASEEQLIAALAAAARVQQRLDQVASRARSLPIEQLVEEAPRAVAPRPLPPPRREPEPERVLTGIERVMLEERLAAERAAALAAAEEERRRAEEEAARRAAMAAQAPAPAVEPVSGRRRERRAPPISVRLPKLSLPSMGGVPRGTLLRYAVAAAPLALAAGVWAAASLVGGLDLPDGEARLAAVSLALAGPGAALGALLARAFFPRLLGLVAIAAVCCLVLVGRALLI
jgi:hypothetical protein